MSFFLLVSMIVAVAQAQIIESETKELKNVDTEQKTLSKNDIQEIESQIARIENKLETNPKPLGWVLVGDANMHLKRFSKAVEAYQNAYLLDDSDESVRHKLERALYHANTKQIEANRQATDEKE